MLPKAGHGGIGNEKSPLISQKACFLTGAEEEIRHSEKVGILLTVCFYFLFAAKFFCSDALCDPVTIEKVRGDVKSITA